MSSFLFQNHMTSYSVRTTSVKWPSSALSTFSSLSGKRHNSINTENYKQAHKVGKEEVGQHNFVDTMGDENAEKV